MNVKDCIEREIRRETKYASQYKEESLHIEELNTQLKRRKVKLMEETNWKELEITLKYKKEEWIEDEVVGDKSTINVFKTSKNKNEVLMKEASRWYHYYLEQYTQEGNIEVVDRDEIVGEEEGEETDGE